MEWLPWKAAHAGQIADHIRRMRPVTFHDVEWMEPGRDFRVAILDDRRVVRIPRTQHCDYGERAINDRQGTMRPYRSRAANGSLFISVLILISGRRP